MRAADLARTPPEPDLAYRLVHATGAELAALVGAAGLLRDEGRGRTVTYSRKVFIPLTTLCRDVCAYCTFAQNPPAGQYLEMADVVAIARAGDAAGCTEALLTLGDRPEDRHTAARDWLDAHGYERTLDYVLAASEAVRAETGLFPHANPGVMDEAWIRRLRPTNVSMGLMLENISPRLLERGQAHFACPDKDPRVRVATIEAAGRARVPFTSGVLMGIGETPRELVDSLFALADLARRHGAIQEVIVQNFRAKADTRMRAAPEPPVDEVVRATSLARWVLGPEMNLQVPPNLTERFEVYLEAGINDWGGVSPLTIDWVNPEMPWPHLAALQARTEAAGFVLRPRLPAYPEFLTPGFVDPGLLPAVEAAVDEHGYALAPARC